jgi:hypothetical protein
MHLRFRLSLVCPNNFETYSSFSNADECTVLQRDMGSVQKRYLDNGMKLNVSKTTLINCI